MKSSKLNFGAFFLIVGGALLFAGLSLRSTESKGPGTKLEPTAFNAMAWNEPMNLQRWNMLTAITNQVRVNVTSEDQARGLLGANYFPATLPDTGLAMPLFGFSEESETDLLYYLGKREVDKTNSEFGALRITLNNGVVGDVEFLTLGY